MANLKDWDFPVPDPIILAWLSLLETLVWGGLVIFAIAIFYEGGFISLPFSPNGYIIAAVLVVLFVVLTLIKFKDNDLYL